MGEIVFKETHFDSEDIFAHIRKNDGDKDDIPVFNLEPKPKYTLQPSSNFDVVSSPDETKDKAR